VGVPSDVVEAENTATVDIRQGEVLEMTDKVIEPSRGNIWLKGDVPSANGVTVGIAIRPIKKNAIDKIQITGVTMALVNVTDTSHGRASVESSKAVLQSSADGPFRVLYKPSGTGEKECVVLFGSSGATNSMASYHFSGSSISAFATIPVLNEAAKGNTSSDGPIGGWDETLNVFDGQVESGGAFSTGKPTRTVSADKIGLKPGVYQINANCTVTGDLEDTVGFLLKLNGATTLIRAYGTFIFGHTKYLGGWSIDAPQNLAASGFLDITADSYIEMTNDGMVATSFTFAYLHIRKVANA
jgi:hypothetical protein